MWVIVDGCILMANDFSSALSYCVEILPRLRCVQISLLLTDYHKLSLSKDFNLILRSNEEKERDPCRSFGSCELDLTTCSPVQLISGVLSLRIKTVDAPPPIPPPSDPLVQWETSSVLTVSCGFCSSRLTSGENSFRRVLPLPSESWEEFSGGVFCHYHHRLGDDVEGREVVTPSAFRITPREGDCLYSMSTLLLTEKALDVRRVYKEPTSQNIHCKRCLQLLGNCVVHKGSSGKDAAKVSSPGSVAVSLQRLKVKVEVSGGGYLCPTGSDRTLSEDHFAFQLYSHTKSMEVFRYLVKDYDGHSHLHIWMLNVCSEMWCNSSPGLLSKFSGSGCDKSATNSGSVKVLKLLFKCEVEAVESGGVGSDLELSVEECLRLKLLLVDNNRSLPPAHRIASAYNVGYLRFFTPSNCDTN